MEKGRETLLINSVGWTTEGWLETQDANDTAAPVAVATVIASWHCHREGYYLYFIGDCSEAVSRGAPGSSRGKSCLCFLVCIFLIVDLRLQLSSSPKCRPGGGATSKCTCFTFSFFRYSLSIYMYVVLYIGFIYYI